jgi:hypothetical protein
MLNGIMNFQVCCQRAGSDIIIHVRPYRCQKLFKLEWLLSEFFHGLTIGALANQRQKLRASFFLIAEYGLDGETGGAATEAQILERNESRDIHMPRGALNTEGPKNQNPRPFAQTAR